MCFYSFFARFWVSYRVFLGGCLHFFGGFLVYSLVKSNKYKILILKITKK